MNLQKASDYRWEIAQKEEKKLWDSVSKNYIKEHSSAYIKKAEYFKKIISSKKKITQKTKFLQIGCACADIINYLNVGQRYSIDPLADFYKSRYTLNYDECRLIKGVGESLPYKDDFFDVVILSNVLDHTKDPLKVLSEIKRVLKKDGLFYFENHFYQKEFLQLSKIYSKFKKIFFKELFNPCHPHQFLLNDLKQIIYSKFKIIFEDEIGKDVENGIDNIVNLKNSLLKDKITRKIPAYFNLFGTINFTCLCTKK